VEIIEFILGLLILLLMGWVVYTSAVIVSEKNRRRK
tara:strand:+ start:1272 stop:1379 length:108 start_codon:yes stop_codon:yes gene_type:complete